MALSDLQAREIIINQLKKNIFVVAGAGSGKTSILISRMVMMVESGYDISKFCTITFTVNAAAEFLSRFRGLLKKRSGLTIEEYLKDKFTLLPPPNEITRQRCKEALGNIDLAFMGTIDSFCQKIVSEHPFEAEVPASSSVITEDELLDLYSKEFDNIINGVAPYNDKELQEYLSDFLKLNDNPAKVFKASINEVINASSLEIQSQPTYEAGVKLEDKYRQILDTYRDSLIEDLLQLYRYCGKAINFSPDIDKYKDSLKAWQKFIDSQSLLLSPWPSNKIAFIAYQIHKLTEGLIFSEDPEMFVTKPFTAYKFKETSTKKGQKVTYFKRDTKDPDFQIAQSFKQEVDNFVYDYSLPFLKKAATLIRMKFKKEGKLSFNQWLLCIKNVLENDHKEHQGKLINHITDRYQYFMLDESQDTSPFQTTIFELLTKETSGKCTLFIVGDPKQSIYRFRGADVESYARTRNKYYSIQKPEEVDLYTDVQVSLTKNFRSSKEMREYFNDIFVNLENFAPIEIEDDAQESQFHSGAYTYQSDDLITMIKGMIDNENYQTFDVASNKFRTLNYRDFMIITYTKGHQQEIVHALSQENIPFNLEGENVFSRCDLVKAVYAVYAYVANPNNATFYNLLTSSFFGLTPTESLMVNRDKGDIPVLINKESQVNFVNQLMKDSHKFNPLTLYRFILENLSLFSTEKYEKIEYLFFIEEKIKEAISVASIASLQDGDLFLRTFLSKKSDRVSALSYKPKAIYIANLHKVKGLESPVVILFKSGNTNKPPSSRLDFLEQKSYLFKIGNRNHGFNLNYFSASSFEFNLESDKEKEILNQEKTRLEYVASTRARDYLLVPSKSGVWNTLPVKQDFVLLERKNPDVVVPQIVKQMRERRVVANFDISPTYRLVKPSVLHQDNKTNKMSEEVVTELNEKSIDSEAAKLGTAVHRLMERLALALPHRLAQKPLIEAVLKEYDLLPATSYESVLKSVFDTLVNQHGYEQNNENAPSDIYQTLNNAKERMCEVPFCYLEDGKMINGVIDLVYLDDGGYHIIDYKTDAVLRDHTAQLKEYIKALKIMFGVDADAKLYHIKIK